MLDLVWLAEQMGYRGDVVELAVQAQIARRRAHRLHAAGLASVEPLVDFIERLEDSLTEAARLRVLSRTPR